jgi:hypothetical protein
MADWRIDNAKHTQGALLVFHSYTRWSESWDHDHCRGCWAKFMESGDEGALTEGYSTQDNYHWICANCFSDLKDVMDWKLAPNSN